MAVVAGTKFITYNPNLDLQERRSTGPNDKTRVYTIEEISAAAAAVVEGTYLEVDITSTETSYSDGRSSVASGILAMGTTPIEILPAPGANLYYSYSGVIEYTHVATRYTFPSTEAIVIGSQNNYSGTYIQNNLIADTVSQVAHFGTYGVSNDLFNAASSSSFGVPLNYAVDLFTFDTSDPTLGDGTIKVKIWYTVKTFG